jgi:hypothetical protein
MPWTVIPIGRVAIAVGASLYWGLASDAVAAPCTDGLDCYCDCVDGIDRGDSFANAPCAAKGIPVDPQVLLCEDFENPGYHEDIGTGGGPPNFGSWYDDTGFPGNRGYNSAWSQTYGAVSGTCSWHEPDPVNPQRGTACAFPDCSGGEWRADDLWDANAHACMDVMRSGEFDDEVATNQDPVHRGVGAGVFDGQQTMAHRVPQGDGLGTEGITPGGFHGTRHFPQPVAEISVTQALAYPSDVLSSLVWENPWKDNQFGGGQEHWHRGSTGLGLLPDALPYLPFRFAHNPYDCSVALSQASLLLGEATCNCFGLAYGADPDIYRQSRDFPWGTWGCSQAYMSGMNTDDMTIQLWHDGVLIFHLTGFDAVSSMVYQTYGDFSWNSYANFNQVVGQATTQTTYRYEDNVHIRNGPPVPCAQIGFDRDGDGRLDMHDVCAQIANPDQRDTNQDGYGNLCDTDFDDDGTTGGTDFVAFKAAFGTSTGAPGYDAHIDLDGDGSIGGSDFAIFKSMIGNPPGPSGLLCAGSIPCPAP